MLPSVQGQTFPSAELLSGKVFGSMVNFRSRASSGGVLARFPQFSQLSVAPLVPSGVLILQQQDDVTTRFKSQSGVRQGKRRRYLPQLCTESKEALSERTDGAEACFSISELCGVS